MIDDAARLVDRHLPPVVRAADVLVAVGRVGLVAELARARDRVELPEQLAGEHVVGADVAWRRHGLLARLAAEDHDVAPDSAGARRHRARARALGTQEADPHVDDAVFAERRNRFARARVNLLEKAVDREDQPAVLAVGALPVVDALARDAAQTRRAPRSPCRSSRRARRARTRCARGRRARHERTPGLKTGAPYG